MTFIPKILQIFILLDIIHNLFILIFNLSIYNFKKF